MMKKIFTPVFCFFAFVAQAQWSNTTNQFYDTLAMPVTTALNYQAHPIVLTSYPDNGYFVIWEDARTPGNNIDIYAQKYDKKGKALWAKNGVVVVAGVDNQRLAPLGTVADYRYNSHACTDSAGGFYVVWEDDNQIGSQSSDRHRVCAQHMLSGGKGRFPYPGFIVKEPEPNIGYQFGNPQLIADGNKGCFIAYERYGNLGSSDLFVNCYRDDNGTMKLYGGNQADLNAENKVPASCGISDAIITDIPVIAYQIYPDLQGGCNIIFVTEFSVPGNNRQRIGFNRLCRVKKQSDVTIIHRIASLTDGKEINFTLKKDSVVMLYTLQIFYFTTYCGGAKLKSPIITYLNSKVENFGNGFLNISDLSFKLDFPKGVMVPTDGNTNVNLIANNQRDFNNKTGIAGDWYKQIFIRNEEIYDSIPYQLTTDTATSKIFSAYKIAPNNPLDKINESNDTLMDFGVYGYDFSFVASNKRIFATGMIQNSTPGSIYPRWVNLQQLQVDRMSPDSFAVHYHTPSKTGVNIGTEIATGSSDKNIQYNNPIITTDQRGNALFTINSINRSIRVSPIADSGRLEWGAMGRPIATGLLGGHNYSMTDPYADISPSDGTAVLAWTDNRYIAPPYSYDDIYMRHLDSLSIYDYTPPPRAVDLLYYSGTFASPLVLTGTSHNWSYLEGYNINIDVTSTMAAIYDNFNLGSITAIALDNPLTYPVRTYNGKPYLNRNYTITPENNPNGRAVIDMRLYFTTAQFAALQKADPTITSPADLLILKQPNTTGTIPSIYTPSSGEELIVPTAWSEVDGGYYLQLQVSGFSNFYIQKNNGALPVTWLNIQAQRENTSTVLVKWSVATESNIKNYLVQYSEDGVLWRDGCTISANNMGSYSCMLNLGSDKKYFFKIKETDLDGRYNISKIVWINKLLSETRFTISPNPVHDDANLNYSLPIATDATIKLINTNGAVLSVKKTMLGTSGSLTVPMNGLPSGIYNLQIITTTDTRSLKILKD